MVSNVLPELPSPAAFASELIKARTELGLTQSKLAEQSGLSVSAVKAYESGRNLPGARELRELCQALQISPNKLLFGTEVPFKERTFANLLVDGTEEGEHVLQGRVAGLMRLLSKEEQAAVGTLVQSLAIARHGVEKAQEATLVMDAMVGVFREFGQQTRDALNTGKPIDAEAGAERLDEFLRKQGHVPVREKLPKK